MAGWLKNEAKLTGDLGFITLDYKLTGMPLMLLLPINKDDLKISLSLDLAVAVVEFLPPFP